MEHPDKQFIENLNQLITEHLAEVNYSVEDLCQAVGVSRSQLFRIVKEQTGLPPSLYIRQLRLQKAKELLDNSSLRIAEITYQVGIDSPQSFTKHFTEAFGISPTQYRKANVTETPTLTEVPSPQTELPTLDLPSMPKLSEQHPVNKPGRWIVTIGILLVLVLSVGAVWYFAKTPKAYALAVLPFKNVGNKASDYFCEGVTDQIHSYLVLLKDLKVISKNSSNLYANTSKTTQTIGTELGVSHLIGGTVWQVGSNIRITVQLIEVASDQTVWSHTYDGQTADIFSFISTLAKQVATELQQNLTLTERTQLERVPTRNLDAYNAYLQGKYLVSTRNKEKLEASLLKFDEAIALDPAFADAYAQKSEAYFSLGNLSHIPLDSSFKLTEQAALSAIRLDPQNSLAYGSLACVYRDRYQWEQANTTYQIALKHNPNNAQVLYWYSLMLRSLDLLEQATQYSTKAVSLDPLSPVIMSGHIRNCSYANNQPLLKEALRKGELFFNNSFLFYWSRSYDYLVKQRYADALADLQKVQQLNPNLKGVEAAMAYTQARLGNRAATQAYLAALPNTPDNLKFRVIAVAGLPDQEACLQLLETMAAQGEIPTDLKVTPFFHPLHKSPRFEAILRKFNLSKPTIQVQ